MIHTSLVSPPCCFLAAWFSRWACPTWAPFGHLSQFCSPWLKRCHFPSSSRVRVQPGCELQAEREDGSYSNSKSSRVFKYSSSPRPHWMQSLHLAIAFLSASHTLCKTKLQPSVSSQLLAFIVQAPRTKLKKNNENKQILNTTTFHALSPSQALIIPKNRATNRRDKKW